PMQRSARPFRCAFAIEGLGFAERVRVHGDERVKAGAAMVECLDPIEIRLNQSLGCGAARSHRLLLIRDRRFGYFKGLRVNARSAGDPKGAEEKTPGGLHPG